jgi:hypothetical protein
VDDRCGEDAGATPTTQGGRGGEGEQIEQPVCIVPLTCMRGTCYACLWLPRMDCTSGDSALSRGRLWSLCPGCRGELIFATSTAACADSIPATSSTHEPIPLASIATIKLRLTGEAGKALWDGWRCGDARAWHRESLGRFLAEKFDRIHKMT